MSALELQCVLRLSELRCVPGLHCGLQMSALERLCVLRRVELLDVRRCVVLLRLLLHPWFLHPLYLSCGLPLLSLVSYLLFS